MRLFKGPSQTRDISRVLPPAASSPLEYSPDSIGSDAIGVDALLALVAHAVAGAAMVGIGGGVDADSVARDLSLRARLADVGRFARTAQLVAVFREDVAGGVDVAHARRVEHRFAAQAHSALLGVGAHLGDATDR